MIYLSQAWTPRLLRSLAEEHMLSAREHMAKNWTYQACRDLAAMDALLHLAEVLESSEKRVVNSDRVEKVRTSEGLPDFRILNT